MRIACVHQGYELYGSDRCFIESVATIRKAFPRAEIEVVLPRPGLIVAALEPLVDRVSVEPVWVLRRRLLSQRLVLALVTLPLALTRAARRFAKSDLVYINTSVVIDYQIVARFFRRKALLHIHEIPTGVARGLLRALAAWSGTQRIFNSRATREAFAPLAGEVIYNGVHAPPPTPPVDFDGQRPLRLLLLGRFSQIKGQEVLIRALASMPAANRAQFRVRIVGGAFENPELEMRLAEMIAETDLSECVSIEPFVPCPWPLYGWADVVVVPSRLPESLGRVAIEAMAHGRPVLASSIGGLKEVVEDGRTGWFTPPDEPAVLAERLLEVLTNPTAISAMGAAGRARYEAVFSEQAAVKALGALVERMAVRVTP